MCPSPGREKRLAIRFIDWQRLKRKLFIVRDVGKQTKKYHLFLDIAMSGLALIPFAFAREVPSWIKVIYASFVFLIFLIKTMLAWIDRRETDYRQSELDEILEDLQDVESTFGARVT